jgi:hypothetical protein
MSHKGLDELPLEIPKAHDVVRVAYGGEAPIWGDGDRGQTGIGLHICMIHKHKIQYTQPSAKPINTTCISMPYTMISDDSTHILLCCDRQRLVLLCLNVPYAHGVVSGAGDDEAAIT